MTLVLKLEHAPQRQSRMEYRLDRGDFSIGRGQDADWPIDDPDMFVSRRHCVISGGDGEYTVTDASRGGLFLDGAEAPLGPGNSAKLENGTRLRMGDYVFFAEIAAAAAEPRPRTATPRAAAGFDADDFFSTPATPQPKAERPENLPDPFEGGGRDFFSGRSAEPEDRKSAPPPAFDDPFSLGHSEVQRPRSVAPQPKEDREGFSLSGSFWDDAQKAEPVPEPAPEPVPEPAPRPRTAVPQPVAPPEPAVEPTPVPAPEALVPQMPVAATDEAALRAAFYKGLGLDPDPTDDPVAEMEALGNRFRLLVDGLQHLLRARAQEKQNARVAATVIGQADVNPLKFMVTTDEAIASLVRHRGKGYLEPDVAITAAYRDIAEHSLKNWTGLQAALRRMIDRFDPEAIETEMEEVGALEALLAGGRSAKLWQLYEERYKQIARAAEERFLGEVGQDFRDAYEGRK